MENWQAFFKKHQHTLETHYPGLTEQRFIREAEEIGGDGLSFLRGVPFEYQLGYAEFYGLAFGVDPRVLIPRSETELLTDKMVEWIKTQPGPLKGIDVCTGSGCIGLSIAHHFPDADITLTDISPDVLEVTRKNAAIIAPQVKILESDLLADIHGKFDFIISNPPYIPLSERNKTVHAQVDQYEPALALYVNDEEYEEFFRMFFAQVRIRLKAGGLFMMEGQPERLEELAEWATEQGFRFVEIQKDWADRLRFLRFTH